MMAQRTQIAAWASGLLLFGVAALVLAEGPPVFSHREHFEMDDELGCDGCHVLGKGRPTLKKAQCLECHDEAPTGYSVPQAVTALRATFPHGLHADSLECADCHPSIPEDGAGKKMDAKACHACHDDNGIELPPGNCSGCHSEVPDFDSAARGMVYSLPHGSHADSFDCTDCHRAAPPGRHGEVISGAGHCFSCHEENGIEALPPSCDGCHDAQPEPRRTRLPVDFPHAKHARAVPCGDCHAAAVDDGDAHGATDLTAERCFACHGDRDVSPGKAACAACHGVDAKRMEPNNHRSSWRAGHGRDARWLGLGGHGDNCRSCHRPATCDACHRVEMPRSHTGLWRQRSHGAAAAWDRESCKTCHETGQCVRCHQTTTPLNHRGAWSAIHGLSAVSRANETCLVCHRPATCIACHRENQ